MSWTRTPSPEQATGAAAEAYATLRGWSSRPHVSNIWQTLALDPRGLLAWFAARRELMDDPAPLSAAQAEAIVLVVSATNGCAYSVTHYGPRLAKTLGDESLARAIALDYRAADLPARDRVLL